MSTTQKTEAYLQNLLPRIYIPGIMFDDLNLMEQKTAMKLFALELSDKQFQQIFFDNDCLFFEPNVIRSIVRAIDPYQDTYFEKESINLLLKNLTEIIFKLLVGSDQNGALGKLFVHLREHYELYSLSKKEIQ